MALGVGTRVMGEWSPGSWYPGQIGEASADGSQYFVLFDDGDRAWLTPERIATRLAPGAPLPATGTRVLGLWSNGSWYSGRVGDVRASEAFVQFDDGDRAWLPPEKIAPIPTPAAPQGTMEGLVIGARVMGEWTPNAWYPGTIGEVRAGEVYVQFDDGDVAWLPPHRVRLGGQARAVPMHVPSGPSALVERVIERQVLVVRCQYCKTITPADQPACQHCGGVPI